MIVSAAEPRERSPPAVGARAAAERLPGADDGVGLVANSPKTREHRCVDQGVEPVFQERIEVVGNVALADQHARSHVVALGQVVLPLPVPAKDGRRDERPRMRAAHRSAERLQDGALALEEDFEPTLDPRPVPCAVASSSPVYAYMVWSCASMLSAVTPSSRCPL